MHFEKRYFMRAKAVDVIKFMQNTEQFAGCIPNLQKYEKVADRQFRLYVTQKFSFIKSTLVMDWTIMDFQGNTGKLLIKGNGIGMSFEALVTLTLSQEKACTEILLAMDITPAGLLKQVPESVLAGAANVLADDILSGVAKNLRCELRGKD